MEIPTEVILEVGIALLGGAGGGIAWFKKRFDSLEVKVDQLSEQNATLRETNAKLEATVRLLGSHGKKTKEIESILNNK